MSINVRAPGSKVALQNSYKCCPKIGGAFAALPKPSARSTRPQIQAKWSTSSTLIAGPLLAVALSLAPPAPAAETKATVPLNRDVVETMLMQRFKERIQGMSDAELAQVTERLLAESAAFPIDLVSAPPTRAQIAPPPPPPPAPLFQEEEPEEEDADDTTELLKALQSTIVNASASPKVSNSSPQSILDSMSLGTWGPKAATAARAVGIGAGVAAAAAIGLRTQVPAAEQEPGQSGSNQTSRQPENAVETSFTAAAASGGWLGRFFSGKEAGKDVVAPVAESSSNGTLPAEKQVESPAGGPSPPPPRQLQPRRPSSPEAAPSGGVLWQRSEAGAAGDTLPAAPPSDQGQVLWRRREVDAGGGPLPQQQGASDRDLWRMPMEELQRQRSGGGGESEPVAAEGVAGGPRMPRPPRLRPNALDNAETAV